MAEFAVEFDTKLPDVVVDEIIKLAHDYPVKDGTVFKPDGEVAHISAKRDSLVSYIPTDVWIGPMMWYWIQAANRRNFRFNITSFDTEMLQYTEYNEGQYYHWHPDQHLYTEYTPNFIPSSKYNQSSNLSFAEHEYVRKLAFSLQLSGPDDYDGGELQFLDAGKLMTAPKAKGRMIIFDARTMHRVRKVKSGCRKSLVGWVVGPRWA